MGVPCMPVRPMCIVIGQELHGALGTLVPPGLPFAPSDVTLWVSGMPTYYGVGDPPVANVIICGERAVQRGADTKYFRLHLVAGGLVPPNVVVGPIYDLGYMAFVFAVGASKPVWGPTTVKVGPQKGSGKSIAVIGIPYVPFNPFNQLICSDPCDWPGGAALQMPSSVFAGMSLADYLLCCVSIMADMLLSFILNVLFGGLEFIGKYRGEELIKGLIKKLGPTLGKFLGKGMALGFELAFRKFRNHAWKVIGKPAARYLGRMLSKAGEEGLKKLASTGMGSLSPDDFLGFGNDPPAWAR
ncbi:uncharacterized protein SOCE26_029650 [Sorangium cellulosum]|uniref:Uncharacterized protein n=1 Tax=Sorangium cellulosum TaxID=56 RepID=A0A2L0EQJ7_SORCE|nr:hypothetical protein [Sorangium cellulosum]AUX41545.1 uncharacterized protein SOCE26_029650 [Sorangium cellulosum]